MLPTKGHEVPLDRLWGHIDAFVLEEPLGNGRGSHLGILFVQLEDEFAALRSSKSAKERIVAPEAVVAAAPDLILASWCGRKFQPEQIRRRAGWDAIPAVRNGRIVEIKSPLILQPGPAALTDGLDAVRAAIAAV